MITLACVLAPLGVVSVWASAELSNTDAYIETVAPLAHDPAVQKAISRKGKAQVALGLHGIDAVLRDNPRV